MRLLSATTSSAPLVFTLLVLAASPATARAESAKIDPSVVTFLNTYCLRCHGPDEQNASLRFDTLPAEVADGATAQTWQDVLDVLNLDEMPPEGAEQPADEELSRALETLTKNMTEARERLSGAGGRAVLRRMNRREYQNTIRELFGLDISIDSLPDDATVDGFDTIALAHSFSSLHLERYLSTGGHVVETFIKRGGGNPKPEVKRFEPETFKRGVREFLEKVRKQLDSVAERAKKQKPSADGRLSRVDFQVLQQQLVAGYLSHPAAEAGIFMPFRGLVPSFKTNNPVFGRPGVYKVRIRCGVLHPKPVEGVFLEVSRVPRQTTNVDRVDCFEVQGTVDEPQVIEFETVSDGTIGDFLTLARRTPRREVLARFQALAESDARYLNRVGGEIIRLADDDLPSVWVDWIETEGPFPRFEASLQRSDIALHPTRTTDDEARQVIRDVATKVYRGQQPDEEFLDRVWDIYQMTRQNGGNAQEAITESLKVVLASPRFLFLHEPSIEGQTRALTGRELAVRLSYFLWSGPPDEALYRAVESGELGSPDGLAKQVDRMLAAEKSEAFITHFVTQFFELDRLDGVNPEATDSPKYDRALQAATKQEVIEFFRFLLQEDRPASDMIDADYVFVNSLLADFYGINGVRGDEYRMVQLPADSPRGGLLGQSAILTLTGTGERTSPVERGAYVLRKFLDRPPPPAPANVPMLDPSDLGDRSIRETLAVHMTKPQCSSCHRRIDPLGFGLENFDPVGLWRESVLSADGTKQFSIEPAGLMPDGRRSFSSPEEMKDWMMEDRDAFLTGLTKAMMTYGIGRKVGFPDQVEVERVVAVTAAKGYGLRTLIHEIIRSKPFQTK